MSTLVRRCRFGQWCIPTHISITFGGVRGVVDEADVNAGSVAIYAPEGFMEEAIAENVYAGNAMSRRAGFQYGRVIPSGPFGQVDSAIGKGLAAGTAGLIAPTVVVTEDFEEHMIDGVRVSFSKHPGHRSTGRNECLVSGQQSVLGCREYHCHRA